MVSVKIYYFGQNEQIIAQSVDILDDFWPHFGRVGECDDAPFGTSADGAADMALGCGGSASWQYETLWLGKHGNHGVDMLFKECGLALREHGIGS